MIEIRVAPKTWSVVLADRRSLDRTGGDRGGHRRRFPSRLAGEERARLRHRSVSTFARTERPASPMARVPRRGPGDPSHRGVCRGGSLGGSLPGTDEEQAPLPRLGRWSSGGRLLRLDPPGRRTSDRGVVRAPLRVRPRPKRCSFARRRRDEGSAPSHTPIAPAASSTAVPPSAVAPPACTRTKPTGATVAYLAAMRFRADYASEGAQGAASTAHAATPARGGDQQARGTLGEVAFRPRSEPSSFPE
jgi:hypothetical protein